MYFSHDAPSDRDYYGEDEPYARDEPEPDERYTAEDLYLVPSLPEPPLCECGAIAEVVSNGIYTCADCGSGKLAKICRDLQAVLDSFGASLFFHEHHAAIWIGGKFIGVVSHQDGGTDLVVSHEESECPDCKRDGE